MKPTHTRSFLDEYAKILRTFATTISAKEMRLLQPSYELSSDGQILWTSLRNLEDFQISQLQALQCKPYFLLNGLTLASELEQEGLAFALESLAVGFEEFADYFVFLHDRGLPAPTCAKSEMQDAQQRYFAYLFVQMPECGMDFATILMTAKGDAVDLESSLEFERLLREGPSALRNTRFLKAYDLELFNAYLETNEQHDWLRFKKHLVYTYNLPSPTNAAQP